LRRGGQRELSDSSCTILAHACATGRIGKLSGG
jgi:hypothetical protein